MKAKLQKHRKLLCVNCAKEALHFPPKKLIQFNSRSLFEKKKYFDISVFFLFLPASSDGNPL